MTTVQRNTVLTVAAGVVAGLIAGRLIAPDAPRVAGPARDVHTREIRTMASSTTGVDRALLRAELRAALADATPDEALTGDAERADAVPVPEPTAEERAAADTGRVLYEGAVSRGRWRDEDGDRMRAAMDAMAAPDREALIEEFVTAINARRIVSDRPIIL